MAQSGLFKELYCSVCLGIFNNPVSLPCDHTFCRPCIQNCQDTPRPRCPECRARFAAGAFKPNRALRNMAERLKAELYRCTCPEHQEKMKLFCQTDGQLICVVCRDGLTHRGHACVPVGEAAAVSKGELGEALEFLREDNGALARLISQQDDEMRKIKEKSTRLTANVGARFTEVYRFLREREAKLKEEVREAERRALAPMQENLAAMTQALKPRRERESELRSGLDIEESDRFQQWWLDTGSPIVDELRNRVGGTGRRKGPHAVGEFKSEADDLRVTPDGPCSLFLGPYESHLQLFVWKEMLPMIRPAPDSITVEDNDDPVFESVVRPLQRQARGPEVRGRVVFREGSRVLHVPHVEPRGVPVRAALLGAGESVCRLNGRFGKLRLKTRREVPLDLAAGPRVVGTYLDCDRKRVAFYDGDTAALIAAAAYVSDGPLYAYFNPGFYLQGENADPLAVRQYGRPDAGSNLRRMTSA
ncbi:nuclear factor 7, brain-like [Anguilla anguilla]|uniref:nuclear factor 7, brain-like n=1 Tax=Anguilla anguilla TaxID=7936 RepID=UPI0015AE992F|nr:nuclear factor 7, brain-like [Anguilla anguilla]